MRFAPWAAWLTSTAFPFRKTLVFKWPVTPCKSPHITEWHHNPTFYLLNLKTFKTKINHSNILFRQTQTTPPPTPIRFTFIFICIFCFCDYKQVISLKIADLTIGHSCWTGVWRSKSLMDSPWIRSKVWKLNGFIAKAVDGNFVLVNKLIWRNISVRCVHWLAKPSKMRMIESSDWYWAKHSNTKDNCRRRFQVEF